MSRKRKQTKTLEELLAEALVPEEEQPYELPKNWVWVRLGSLSKVTGGGTPKSSVEEYYNGEIPWITPADLSGYKDKYISQGKRNITKSGLKNSSAKLLPKNTLLLSSRAPVGYVALAANLLCTNQGFKSFPPTEAYVPDYGYWYLRFAKHIVDEFASGTTFKEISGSKAAKVPFPLPPLSEQKRIVDRVESLLGKIEEAKGLIQEARDSFEQRRAALLDRAFRGELTRTWREQHPGVEPADRLLERIREEKASMEIQKGRRKKAADLSPIDPPYELPEGWKWARVGELYNVFGGGTPAKSNSHYWNGNIPWVSPKDMKTRIIKKTVDTLTEEGLENTTSDQYRAGSVVMVVRSGILNRILPVAILGKDSAVNQDMKVFVSSDDWINRYFYWYIESNNRMLLSRYTKSGTTVKSFMTDKFLDHLVPLPPYVELKSIVRQIDRLIDCEEEIARILEIDEVSLKQSILTQAFRGQLGTHDPAEESALELLKRTLADQNGLDYESPVRETLQVAEQGELYLT